jgi:hypothetical protein
MAQQERRRQKIPSTHLFTREKVLYCGDEVLFWGKRLRCTKARKRWLRETKRKSRLLPRSTAPYDRLKICSAPLKKRALHQKQKTSSNECTGQDLCCGRRGKS